MKLALALASLGLAAGKKTYTAKTVPLKDVKADSPMGQKLLSQARRVEENGDDAEVDFTWVADYSLKFQGCHHVSQWNEEADGEEDVRIATKRLVRFRLCPSNDCTTVNAGGCNSGYGEYIIDMNIYLEAYMQAKEAYDEWHCEWIEANKCDCDGENQGDDFDEEICLWDCYVEEGLEATCADNNPYNDDEEEEAFELEAYMECANWEPQNENNNNNANYDENGEEIEYFMGPYCADNGGEIRLGLFTDETCTTFADEYGGKETYEQMEGEEMPYAEESIITMQCVSCKEPEEVDANNDGNDNEDEDEVNEMCEQIYEAAGKCESQLTYGVTGRELNENACNYMEGIKIVRKNGVIQQNSSKANTTASVFIGIFVTAFVLLAAYVYYLKTKLDRASINLASDE